jgi:RNA polymerase sigma-70 factor, ECF subfamily
MPTAAGSADHQAEAPTVRSALTPDEFATMTAELAQPLMAAALRLTRRRADAEDLVQDTLHRAFRSLGSFERGTRFKAWMFRILRNAFINRGKREAAAPAAFDPTEVEHEARPATVPDLRDLEDLAALADEHFDERVKLAVEHLSDTFRVPFVLYALGDLSYQEIADALEVPIGTVMSRLHRARSQLKLELAAFARANRVGGGRPGDAR